jgi:hypothetical protein
MTAGSGGVVGAGLQLIARFQSNVGVRAAEAAFLVVFLGGFYAVALIRVVVPYSRGPTHTLLTAPSLELRVALTAIAPFGVVVLEWLAALAKLREQPGYAGWSLRERLFVWLEIITVAHNSVGVVYIPLVPVALFWTVVTAIRLRPFWFVPAAIFLATAAAVVGLTWYVNNRSPDLLPPGTALERVVETGGWLSIVRD